MNWTILWSKISANTKAINEIKNLSPFSYKGSVPTFEDLPKTANKGDVYSVKETGEEWLYTGTIWLSLSKDITEDDIQKALGYIPPSKQYIDEEDDKLKQRIIDIEESRLPNVIIHGEPVINGSQMSGFSPDSYAKFPFLMTLNHPFEIKFALTTGSDVNNQQNILDSDFGLAFAIRNSKFVIALSSNGTTWDLGENIGVYNIQTNTSYLVKISWDGIKYEVLYSLDGGSTYIVDITRVSSLSLYPKQIYIGVGESESTVLNSFKGVIDFRYASLTVNNQPIWLGYADINLLTRLAVDLENIDPAGVEKIKEIIRTENYNKNVGLSLDANNEINQNGSKLLTNNTFTEKLSRRNSLLGLIAKNKIKETSMKWSELAQLARAGMIENLFNIGDQFVDTWKDTAANVSYEYPFQLNEIGTAELEDGEVINGAFLQAHFAHPFGVQFSQCRAFLACPDGLAAGTYTIKFAQAWGSFVDLQWTFTLTKAVPSGGRLGGFRYLADSAKTSFTIYSYAANGVDLVETVTATPGTSGTLLGTLNYDTRNGNLNSMQEAGYGFNAWAWKNSSGALCYSALRQYLNSDRPKGQWWTAQDQWDIAPDQLASKDGFLLGLNEEFRSALKPIKTVTYLNTVNEGGAAVTTYDLVSLPSLEQMYINPQISGEGTFHRYWKNRSGMPTKMNQGGTYPNIITYAVENHTSAQYIRVRSASRGLASYTWYVGSGGGVSNGGDAYNALRFSPLVFIG